MLRHEALDKWPLQPSVHGGKDVIFTGCTWCTPALIVVTVGESFQMWPYGILWIFFLESWLLNWVIRFMYSLVSSYHLTVTSSPHRSNGGEWDIPLPTPFYILTSMVLTVLFTVAWKINGGIKLLCPLPSTNNLPIPPCLFGLGWMEFKKILIKYLKNKKFILLNHFLRYVANSLTILFESNQYLKKYDRRSVVLIIIEKRKK